VIFRVCMRDPNVTNGLNADGPWDRWKI